MTKELAIRVLTGDVLGTTEQTQEAVKIAVEALSEPSAQPYTENDIQKIQDLEQAQLDKAFELGKQAAQADIIRCKDCKHWRQQTNYAGEPLSFGFCESETCGGRYTERHTKCRTSTQIMIFTADTRKGMKND